jgi:hypothetical protein
MRRGWQVFDSLTRICAGAHRTPQATPLALVAALVCAGGVVAQEAVAPPANGTVEISDDAGGSGADAGTVAGPPTAEESATAAEGAPEDEGLIPFFPEWVPLGPPWDEAAEATRRRPPPLPTPETMIGGETPGSRPGRDVKLPSAETTWLTFVPVPIVMADPNLGFGLGVMPVFLVHPEERIEWILAPSARWNEILGVGATSRVFYYPTVHEEMVVINDMSSNGAFEHKGRFHGRDRFFTRSDFHAGAYIVRDPTRRFFGLGSETEEDDETDYEMRESSVSSDIGYRVLDDLRLAGTMRWRHVRRLKEGDIDDNDDTIDVYGDIQGVSEDTTDVLALGARLTLDLRDSAAIPSRGLLVDLLFEAADPNLFGDVRFLRWRAQVVAHLPIIDDSWISSFRFDYHQVSNTRDTPFWELPTLGGKDRLRGFGVGRYTQEAYLLLTIEQRIRVFETVLRKNRVRVEAAGFMDVGRVYGEGDALTDQDWSAVPGFGFRILLPDSNIVARADVGVGEDGSAIFLVLGYPF